MEIGGSNGVSLYLAITVIVVLFWRFRGKVREPLKACTTLSHKDLHPMYLVPGGCMQVSQRSLYSEHMRSKLTAALQTDQHLEGLCKTLLHCCVMYPVHMHFFSLSEISCCHRHLSQDLGCQASRIGLARGCAA